jgi:chain length determinant protein EpsF
MNITQFLLILNARKWIILLTLLVTVATTLVVSLLLPKQYTASSTLVLNFKSSNPVTGVVLPIQFMPSYLITQADIIGSHNVALKVVDNLKLAESPAVQQQFKEATQGKGNVRDWLAGNLQKKLSAKPSRESSVIEIGFTGSDPAFAATIANAFAEAYIQTSLELSVQPARQSSAWYDQQISQLRENLEKAQTRLSQYQREKGVVLSDERIDVETARLAELSGQSVAAQSAAYDAMSRQSQREASAEVANNSLVQNLKVQMAQSEARLAELEKKTGKNHPEYQRAVAQLESIKQDLDAAIRTATRSVATTASAAQQRLGNMRSAVATQKAKVLELKKKRDEISVLVRDVENAQRIYDSALQRAGQIRLESQSSQTEIAVLNQALPPNDASSPKVMLNTILAFFLGGLLGIAIGFLMELIDRRVRSDQDLSEEIGIPVLGNIMKNQTGRRFPLGLFKPAIRVA